MGYTTEFEGSLKSNKEMTAGFVRYINRFSETRRMKRDPEKIMEMDEQWFMNCWENKLGVDGEYYVGGGGFAGQARDESIVNYNCGPDTQPGLWCDWEVKYELPEGYTDIKDVPDYMELKETRLEWNGGEKFYYYVDWLRYLIKNFFEEKGYKLTGLITLQGEDEEDEGLIEVKDNEIVRYSGYYAEH